jgi:hypothetical protein
MDGPPMRSNLHPPWADSHWPKNPHGSRHPDCHWCDALGDYAVTPLADLLPPTVE